MSQVGKRLREFRKKLKMTQGDLAEGICNRSYVSQIEKGQVIPSPEILEQLATRLNTDLRELWTETENPTFTLIEIQNALRHVVNRIDEHEWEIARKWLLKLQGAQLPTAEKAIFFWAKGKMAEYDGREAEAESHYRDAIDYAREDDSVLSIIRALNSLGFFYCTIEKAERAVPLLNEAYQLLIRYEVGGLLRVSVLLHLGKMHNRLGEYHSAVEHLRQAQSLNTTYGILYKTGELHMALGNSYHHLKKYREAEENYVYAIGVFELDNNQERIAHLYTNLGILLCQQERYEEAEAHLLKAIQTFDELQEENEKNKTTLELVHIYRKLERGKEARQGIDKVLAGNNEQTIARATYALSALLSDREEYDEALLHLTTPLAYFNQYQMYEMLAKTYQLLGQINMKVGQYREAATAFEKGISAYEQRAGS